MILCETALMEFSLPHFIIQGPFEKFVDSIFTPSRNFVEVQ
jgi:hypothetical protein